MRILINETAYEISGEDQKRLIESLFSEATKYYDKMPVQFQVIIDQLARGLLYAAEKKMISKGIDPEKAKEVRPAKKQSPSMKFLELLGANAEEPAGKLNISAQELGGQLYNFQYWFNEDGSQI